MTDTPIEQHAGPAALQHAERAGEAVVGALETAILHALDVDVPACAAAVDALRRMHPDDSLRELAERVVSHQAWRAATVGAVTGLPGSLPVALPAAALDVGAVLHMEMTAAAKVALIFDPRFFDDPRARWRLLTPVVGATVASQILREMGLQGAREVTRKAASQVLHQRALRVARRMAFKVFGKRVSIRAIATKSIPLLGGVIGAGWNFAELHMVGRRVINHFEGR